MPKPTAYDAKAFMTTEEPCSSGMKFFERAVRGIWIARGMPSMGTDDIYRSVSAAYIIRLDCARSWRQAQFGYSYWFAGRLIEHFGYMDPEADIRDERIGELHAAVNEAWKGLVDSILETEGASRSPEIFAPIGELYCARMTKIIIPLLRLWAYWQKEYGRPL